MKTPGHSSGFRTNALEPSRLVERPAEWVYCPGLPQFFITGLEGLSCLPGRERVGHLGRAAHQKLLRLAPVLRDALVAAAWRAECQCGQARRACQLEELGQVLAEAQALSQLLPCCGLGWGGRGRSCW